MSRSKLKNRSGLNYKWMLYDLSLESQLQISLIYEMKLVYLLSLKSFFKLIDGLNGTAHRSV
jgi:hypothetical protein